MSSGVGKYLKTEGGVLHFARVGLEVETLERAGVTVECAPAVFSEMGGPVDPEAPGFLAWRRGAEAGARWAAEVARLTSAAVEIRSIVGTYVDTTERSVAGAAALALWEAVGFDINLAAGKQLDSFVLVEPVQAGS
jgi:hypothetical protein